MKRWLSFLKSGAAPDHVLIESARFVVLDTELTSLDERTNRLLSVGAIGMAGSRIRVGQQFYHVVNPGVPVPPETILIHRLRPEDVELGYDLATTLSELASFISDAVLVAHFGKIDRSVLRKEFASCGLAFDNDMICTARVQQWIVRKRPFKEDQFRELESTDLASLAKAYNVEASEPHNALDDAFVTARLWQKQIHILDDLGLRSLGKLLRIAKV